MKTGSRTQAFLTDDDWEILQRACEEAGVPAETVERMLVAENRVYGMGRRHGIWEALEDLITEGLSASAPKEAR